MSIFLDLLISSAMIIRYLTLILFFSAFDARSACPTFFERIRSIFFAPKHEVIFSENLLKDLKRFEAVESPKVKSVLFQNTNSPKFFFLVSKLPRSMIKEFMSMKNDRAYVVEYRNKLFKELPHLRNTHLDNVFEGVKFVLLGNKNINLKEFFENGLAKYEKLSSREKLEIKSYHEENVLISKAFDNWHKNYHKNIKVLSREGRSIKFTINGRLLEGKIVNKRGGEFVIFHAPKEMFSHPFWNPLNHKYIAEIIARGVKGKDLYPVSVGLNGRLYLLDGNHRSTIDARSKLPAEIPFPMETANLREHFDLIGRSQPTTSELIKIYKGELDPWSLLK